MSAVDRSPITLSTAVIAGTLCSIGAAAMYFRCGRSRTSRAANQEPGNNELIPQFVTGDFVANRKTTFLPDREYGLALDALVKACSDILIISPDGLCCLLGKRRVQPQPDWWFIGGRARPGETTRAAAARNMQRELGLQVEQDRLKVFANYSFVWQYRSQPPADHGTADISTIHVLRLTELEVASVKLDPKEYEAFEFLPMTDIINGGDRYHPALQRAVLDLFVWRRRKDLCSTVESQASDTQVASAARAFVDARLAAIGSSVSRESLKVVFDGSRYIPRSP